MAYPQSSFDQNPCPFDDLHHHNFSSQNSLKPNSFFASQSFDPAYLPSTSYHPYQDLPRAKLVLAPLPHQNPDHNIFNLIQ